jgi:hypothetical protein
VRLACVLARAAGGEAATARIRGYVGVGKAPLLSAALEDADGAAFRIMHVAGRQGEESLPHAGLVSLRGPCLTYLDRRWRHSGRRCGRLWPSR